MASSKIAASAVIEMSLSLHEGEQLTGLLCPFCSGGQHKERSFSLKQETCWVYYKCHRASCDKKGRTFYSQSRSDHTDTGWITEKETELTPFKKATKSLERVPDNIKKILEDKYYYNTTDIARLDAMWSGDMQRLWSPIKTPVNRVIGGVLRTFDKSVKPKSYTLLNEYDNPCMAFYKCHINNWEKVIIVEDQLSACRAANTVSSAALCGTNFQLMHARKLSQLDPEMVVFCLDGDAFAKGLELVTKWGGMFKACKVVKPPRDLKDMPRLQLQDFLRATLEN